MKPDNLQPLLIVEDSDEDFAALKRIIVKAHPHPVYRCEDGDEALDYLYHEGRYEDPMTAPRPSLIMLDLNLPGTDGREVLSALKQDRSLKTIPVVIFSTSSNSKDVNACYRQGISGYLVKPMNTERLNQLVKTFLAYWFNTVELPN